MPPVVSTPSGLPFDLWWAPEARPHSVRSGPDEVFLLEQGAGPAVLMIPGHTCDLAHFRYQLPALAQAGFRALAFDPPGHGHANRPRGPIPASRFVAAALATLDALQIERAHLVGHSVGGTLALTLAARHPDRVAQVALIGPYHPTLPLGSAFGLWVNTLSRIPGLRSLAMALNTRAGFEAGLGAAIHEPRRVLAVDGGRWLDYGWELFDSPGMRQAIVGSGQFLARSWRELLPELPPLGDRGLVLWGVQDGVVLHAGAEGLARALGSRLVSLEPYGHCCHFEMPERVNAELVQHFRG
jgi:pimeloyl-ACP methyl ester carboxylesterase